MKTIWIIFGVLSAIVVILNVIIRVAKQDSEQQQSGLLPPRGQATMGDVQRLVQAGQKIAALKCYREIHHCGLAEAKDAVERMVLPK